MKKASAVQGILLYKSACIAQPAVTPEHDKTRKVGDNRINVLSACESMFDVQMHKFLYLVHR